MLDRPSGPLDADLLMRLSEPLLGLSLRPVAGLETPARVVASRLPEEAAAVPVARCGGGREAEEESWAAQPGLKRRLSATNWQELISVPLADDPKGLIGAGGEGVVYSYVQCEIGREVAVKTIRPDRWCYEAIEGMAREACVTAWLAHPNIVPVHYLHLPEHDADTPYWVMKLIRGKPLTEHLPSGKEPWPTDRLLDVFGRVLDAVAFAHSKGIVHRDLKPDNVMVGEFGEVQVTDWGLAVSIAEEGARGVAALLEGRDDVSLPVLARDKQGSLSPALAKLRTDAMSGRLGALPNRDAGGRAGTPVYMAPEQLDVTAGSVSERTDVFLLGGILYAMLTGRSPHQLVQGDDTDAAKRRMDQIRSCSTIASATERREQCSLARAPEGLSDTATDELSRLTARALARDPADRLPSVDALRTGLAAWESRSASLDLSAQAEARLTRARSTRRGRSLTYAQAMALADAALEQLSANEQAREVRLRAEKALMRMERRVRLSVRIGAAIILLVIIGELVSCAVNPRSWFFWWTDRGPLKTWHGVSEMGKACWPLVSAPVRYVMGQVRGLYRRTTGHRWVDGKWLSHDQLISRRWSLLDGQYRSPYEMRRLGYRLIKGRWRHEDGIKRLVDSAKAEGQWLTAEEILSTLPYRISVGGETFTGLAEERPDGTVTVYRRSEVRLPGVVEVVRRGYLYPNVPREVGPASQPVAGRRIEPGDRLTKLSQNGVWSRVRELADHNSPVEGWVLAADVAPATRARLQYVGVYPAPAVQQTPLSDSYRTALELVRTCTGAEELRELTAWWETEGVYWPAWRGMAQRCRDRAAAKKGHSDIQQTILQIRRPSQTGGHGR